MTEIIRTTLRNLTYIYPYQLIWTCILTCKRLLKLWKNGLYNVHQRWNQPILCANTASELSTPFWKHLSPLFWTRHLASYNRAPGHSVWTSSHVILPKILNVPTINVKRIVFCKNASIYQCKQHQWKQTDSLMTGDARLCDFRLGS